MKAQRRETPEERLPFECACGNRGPVTLKHWQVFLCACGLFYWALQPKKNGPLEIRRHPGFHSEAEIARARARAGGAN